MIKSLIPLLLSSDFNNLKLGLTLGNSIGLSYKYMAEIAYRSSLNTIYNYDKWYLGLFQITNVDDKKVAIVFTKHLPQEEMINAKARKKFPNGVRATVIIKCCRKLYKLKVNTAHNKFTDFIAKLYKAILKGKYIDIQRK